MGHLLRTFLQMYTHPRGIVLKSLVVDNQLHEVPHGRPHQFLPPRLPATSPPGSNFSGMALWHKITDSSIPRAMVLESSILGYLPSDLKITCHYVLGVREVLQFGYWPKKPMARVTVV
jgi:hypothetical protein